MPSRRTPTKLADWPWVVVRVDCALCTRRGCYRLARLAAKYGPEQSIDGLLRDLAANCPWWNERPRKYEPRCGARFPDLERTFPPADHPDEPIYRQRGIEREQLAKRRVEDRFPAVPRGKPPSLSNWVGDEVAYHCQRCPRQGAFFRARLLDRYGDLALTRLLVELTGDCPRRGSARVYELCGAVFLLPGQDRGSGP